MPRELSRAEQEFIIKNHENMDIEDLYIDMPGVGQKTVQDFIDQLPTPKEGETENERRIRMQKSKFGAGRLMGRDKAGRAAVMTEGASNLFDEKTKNLPRLKEQIKDKNDRIFIMDPSKEVK